MYIVYIIQSENGGYYIGSTNNLIKRLSEHNNGQSKWTKRYKNWKIIYTEEFDTRRQALIREQKIKRQKGGDGFYKIIKGFES